MGNRPTRYAVLLAAAGLCAGALLTGCNGGEKPSPPPTGGGTVAGGPSSDSPTDATSPGDPTTPGTSDATTPATPDPTHTSKSTQTGSPTKSGKGSPDEAGAPGVPKAARQHTNNGAAHFAVHYLDVVNETATKPKVGRLEPLASDTCNSCANFAGNVRYMKLHHEHQLGVAFLPTETLIIKDPDPHTTRVRVNFTELPAKVVNSRGKTTRRNDPGDGYFEFVLRWTSRGWIVEKIYAPPS